MKLSPEPKRGKPKSVSGQADFVALESCRVPGKTGTWWRCLCDCGNELLVPTFRLNACITRSCGCLKHETASRVTRERSTKHGLRRHELYGTWADMRRRCRDSRVSRYHRYGGRGIRVCERWDKSFAAFLEDMGEKPSPEHQIDRIDNDGDYCPENCRWASVAEQGGNRSTSVLLEIDGVSKCVTHWARENGLHPSVVGRRLSRGWSPRDAITRSAKGSQR